VKCSQRLGGWSYIFAWNYVATGASAFRPQQELTGIRPECRLHARAAARRDVRF
jgi:hypothetical protein